MRRVKCSSIFLSFFLGKNSTTNEEITALWIHSYFLFIIYYFYRFTLQFTRKPILAKPHEKTNGSKGMS